MNSGKNPSAIVDEIAGGYRGAQVLFTATRLGLFDRIGHGEKSVSELAREIHCGERGLRILCGALASLSLLEMRDGTVRNAPPALEHLMASSPASKKAMMMHGAKLYEKWGRLYDAVITGKRVPDDWIDGRLVGDEHTFAHAMADIGRASARQTADALDLGDCSRLLDIGGGPGLYSIEFVRRNPNLSADILDTEKTIEVAQENVREAGLLERISFILGDVFETPLTREYDFVFLSNVVHIFPYEGNRELIAKCAGALRPGGRVCVKDFILDESRTSPEWCALFAVNMLVGTDGGDCYTSGDIGAWFENAGLKMESIAGVAGQSSLVIGRKPAE